MRSLPALLGLFLLLGGPGLALGQPPRTQGRLSECLTQSELLTADQPLQQIDLSLALPAGRRPVDCSVGLFATDGHLPYPSQRMAELEFHWAASELFHQPLYFDDTLLERYGQTVHPCLQPVLSGAHFFGMFPIMPYKLGLDRPYDRVYTLGYYRPGSPTPCLGRRLPLEADAAGLETAAWLAAIFLLP